MKRNDIVPPPPYDHRNFHSAVESRKIPVHLVQYNLEGIYLNMTDMIISCMFNSQ